MPGAPDVSDVAAIVAEVSESAERPSRGRPVGEVARSALARVVRGGTGVTRRGADVARRGAGAARRGTDTARRSPGVPRRTRRSPARDGYRGTWDAAGGTQRVRGNPLAGQPGTGAGAAAARPGPGHVAGPVPGRSPDELADALIESASRASWAVGAAVGVVRPASGTRLPGRDRHRDAHARGHRDQAHRRTARGLRTAAARRLRQPDDGFRGRVGPPPRCRGHARRGGCRHRLPARAPAAAPACARAGRTPRRWARC